MKQEVENKHKIEKYFTTFIEKDKNELLYLKN